MKSWFNTIFSGSMAFVAAASFTLSPSKVSAGYASGSDCCAAPCQPACCEDPCASSWSSRDTWLLLGSLVAGAAAGAGVGAAVAGHGHRGHQGDPGATGATGAAGAAGVGVTGAAGATGATGPVGTLSATSDVPFGVENTIQSLTFNWSTVTASSLLGGGTVQAYVATPDGRVLEGPVQLIPLVAAPLVIPSIAVGPTNLPYGDYTPGLIFKASGATVITLAALPIYTVTSTRDAITVLNPDSIAALVIATQTEINADFVYGAPTVP